MEVSSSPSPSSSSSSSSRPPPSPSSSEYEDAVQSLHTQAPLWLSVPLHEKIHLLENTLRNCQEVYLEWAKLQVKEVSLRLLGKQDAPAGGEKAEEEKDYNEKKVMDAFGHVVGEAFFTGPAMFANYVQSLLHVLKEYSHNQGRLNPHLLPVEKDSNGNYIVTVLPFGSKEKIVCAGLKGELYLQKAPAAKKKQEEGAMEVDKKEKEGEEEGHEDSGVTRGREFESEMKESGVVFVLGAGNFSAPIEVITKMFIEHKVCLYKPNPVNQGVTSPIFKKIFEELIGLGYVKVIDCDLKTTSDIIQHSCIHQIMLTGSDKTFDAIVWGSPGDKEEQMKRKKSGQKLTNKQVDAELGNINVASIIPGHYSHKELQRMAAHIAHVRLLNGGHTCPSPQILLVSSDWPQLDSFRKELQVQFSSHLPIPSYYPGTDQKYAVFKQKYGEQCVEMPYGGQLEVPPGYLVPLLVPNIASSPETFETVETFCPIIGVYPVDGVAEVQAFCEHATHYINEKVWGNLSTTIFVSPDTLSKEHATIRRMVDQLQVGSVGVNIWGGTSVLFPNLHWGAYPGNHPEDIQSGIGRGVGNFLCYDNVLKAVIWSPFFHDFQQVSPHTPSQGFFESVRITEFNIQQSVWSMIKVASALYLGI